MLSCSCENFQLLSIERSERVEFTSLVVKTEMLNQVDFEDTPGKVVDTKPKNNLMILLKNEINFRR